MTLEADVRNFQTISRNPKAGLAG